jgi:hypothetical protein
MKLRFIVTLSTPEAAAGTARGRHDTCWDGDPDLRAGGRPEVASTQRGGCNREVKGHGTGQGQWGAAPASEARRACSQPRLLEAPVPPRSASRLAPSYGLRGPGLLNPAPPPQAAHAIVLQDPRLYTHFRRGKRGCSALPRRAVGALLLVRQALPPFRSITAHKPASRAVTLPLPGRRAPGLGRELHTLRFRTASAWSASSTRTPTDRRTSAAFAARVAGATACAAGGGGRRWAAGGPERARRVKAGERTATRRVSDRALYAEPNLRDGSPLVIALPTPPPPPPPSLPPPSPPSAPHLRHNGPLVVVPQVEQRQRIQQLREVAPGGAPRVGLAGPRAAGRGRGRREPRGGAQGRDSRLGAKQSAGALGLASLSPGVSPRGRVSPGVPSGVGFRVPG